MSSADAAFYGGLFSAAVFLAAAVTVGWIGGGWILDAADDGRGAKRALHRVLRRLAAVGCLLIVGMIFGAWPLAGGLIMVVGSGAGLVARSAIEGAKRHRPERRLT